MTRRKAERLVWRPLTEEELKAIEETAKRAAAAGSWTEAGEAYGGSSPEAEIFQLIAEVRRLREALDARRSLCDGERLTPEQLTAEARLLGEID